MSTKTPTRRSPRTPQSGQTTDQPPHPEQQPVRYMPNGSRQSSVVSVKAIMDTRSRAGSIVSTRRLSRAGSRRMSTSGGVVGLPSASDDIIDPKILNIDAFFDTDAYDAATFDDADMSKDNQNADEIQIASLPRHYFGQDLHAGLGITMPPTNDEQQGQLDHAVVLHNHQNEAGQNQPDLVPVDSTRDASIDPFHGYPHFAPWDINYQIPTQPLDTTPGLSAFPRDNSFMPQLPVTNQQYPDLFNPMYSTGPYFNLPMQDYTGYVPIDPRLQTPRVDVPKEVVSAGPTKSRRSSYEDDDATAKPKNRRKRAQSDSDSDSEDSVPPVKRRRQIQPVKHKPAPRSDDSRRNSLVSDSSSLCKPVKVAVVRAGEKPKKCEDKSWVRINTTTKGETTRTARINQFTQEGTKYKVKPLSIGDWETDKYKFEYANHNGMDEFKKSTMSARQIHEYITKYPGDHLRIWIQVAPGDSARRYASKPHSQCLFEQCPNRVWANKGTIEVGNYRVAFDEKHKKYGKGVVDPFDCVGYAHLYCMERFLDFAGICEHADVKVDTRGDMKKEPKGEAGFVFSKKHVPERKLAEKFVKAAQCGKLDRTPEFFNYPDHSDYKKGVPKPHQQTLIAAMFNINWEHRARSQLKQFVFRNMLPSACGIHRGDQEIVVVDKKVESLKVFKKAKEAKQRKDFDHSAYYDQFHPEINIRMRECLALRAQFQSEDAMGAAPTRGGSKKRKIAIDENYSDDDEPEVTRKDDDDDFEEIGDEYQHQQRVGSSLGSRSSPRKKQRVNYLEPHDLPQNEAYRSPISPKTRKTSFSRFFAADDSYKMPEQPADIEKVENAPRLTDEELELMMALARRKSSTMSTGPSSSIRKSPKLDCTSFSPQSTHAFARTASFNALTSSKEYNVNDPPSQVATSPDVTRAVYDHDHHGRRSSARLASKTSPSLDKVETGRVSKRHN